MDFNTYRHAYFADPPPEQRFDLSGILGITLYFSGYRDAVDFYTTVLGEPAYVEGAGTRGWHLGDSWLTLLAGGDGAPPGITPGMSVRAKLDIDTGRSGVAVSRDAILRFPDGRVTVWVVDKGKELPVVREQAVRTGFEFAGLVEVTSGLAAGDLVVVRGNETLKDGQTVSILGGVL